MSVPKPANFRCRIARQNEIADFCDAGFATSKCLDDAIAFGACGRIAPKLHRYLYFARSVDRNKAMLLTRNSNSDDALAHAFLDACRGLLQRFNPPFSPLFGRLRRRFDRDPAARCRWTQSDTPRSHRRRL